MGSGERLIKVAHPAKDPEVWILESYNQAYPARFVPAAGVTMIHKVAYVRTMK